MVLKGIIEVKIHDHSPVFKASSLKNNAPPPLSLDVSKYSKSKQKRNKIGTAMTLQPRNSFSFHFTHKNEKKRTPTPLVNVY